LKFTIISIRDITGNSFSTPTYHQSKGTALRSFLTEVNRADENNMLYKYPNDFELMYLGTFDDDNATFELVSQPEQLALAKDYINKQ
jgi:hypothetical protein